MNPYKIKLLSYEYEYSGLELKVAYMNETFYGLKTVTGRISSYSFEELIEMFQVYNLFGPKFLNCEEQTLICDIEAGIRFRYRERREKEFLKDEFYFFN